MTWWQDMLKIALVIWILEREISQPLKRIEKKLDESNDHDNHRADV